MSNKLEQLANINNIIELFGKQYEENPKVILRELIQNAADAITAARNKSPDANQQIVVEILSSDDREKLQADIAVRDFADGMDFSELQDYLATIGSSIKPNYENAEIIGEYGIGFYSVVVACKSAIIVTKKGKKGSVLMYRYIANPIDKRNFIDLSPDVTHSLLSREFEENNVEREGGTTIYIEIDFKNYSQLADWTDQERLKTELRTFCLLIPYPIYIQSQNTVLPEPVNLPNPPWKEEGLAKEDSLEQLWAKHLLIKEKDRQPKSYYNFTKSDKNKSGETKISGIVYFIDDWSGGASIYYKNMFVETSRDIIPSWAKPFSLLINVTSTKGSPNHITVPPSRTHIIKNDSYYQLSKIIGGLIIEMIKSLVLKYERELQVELAATEKNRYHTISNINNKHEIIKALYETTDNLPLICINLCGLISDMINDDIFNDKFYKRCALSFFQKTPLNSVNLTEASIDKDLKDLNERLKASINSTDNNKKINASELEANIYSASKTYLEELGCYFPVSVLFKDHQGGQIPEYKKLRIPLSCLHYLDPGLRSPDGKIRIPILTKGQPYEYFQNKISEKLLIIASEQEVIFLAALAFTKKHEYWIDLVQSDKNKFTEIPYPERWQNMLNELSNLIKDKTEAAELAQSVDVTVASYENDIVPMLIRDNNNNIQFVINYKNLGMRQLNDTLNLALENSDTEIVLALKYIIHDFYHDAFKYTEDSGITPTDHHILDVKQQVIIKTCQLFQELFNIKKK